MSVPLTATQARASTASWAWNDVSDPLDTALETVRALWEEANQALQGEDFDTAKSAIEKALALTRQEHSRDACAELELRLHAGLIAVLLALGEEVSITEVRALLAATNNLPTTVVAAYQLGRMLELQQDWKKAFFYARIALTSAQSCGRTSWQAVSHNLIGNVLVAESRFQEAVSHYEQVLKSDEVGELQKAQASDNLGFSLLGLSKLAEARPYLASALWKLRRVHGPARLSVELDVALFHLLNNAPQRALSLANQALRRAQVLGDRRGRANALLLLVQASKDVGNEFIARRSISELTEIYDADFANALYSIDVLQVVNLKA